MSTHPLSLREQLLARFPILNKVRFSGNSPYFTFFVQTNVDDPVPLAEIERYLADHSPAGVQITVEASWHEGPSWPIEYDQFTDAQRKLIADCNGKRESVGAALRHAFPTLTHVDTVRERGGLLLEVAFKMSTPDVSAEMTRCVLFAHACYAFAPVPLRGKLIGDIEMATPNRDAGLHFSPHTMRGITEPAVRRLFEFDQDSFRDFQSSKYASPRASVQQRLSGNKLSLFWDISHGESGDLDMRSTLPLFDHAYIDLRTLLDHLQSRRPLFGIQPHETTQLLDAGVFIPVASHHLGSYPQQELARLASEHTIVTPFEAAEGIALDMLRRNPLWKLAVTSPDSALAVLRAIEAVSRQSGEVTAHLEAWLEASFNALFGFDSSLRDLGNQIGLRFGLFRILERCSQAFGIQADTLLLSVLDTRISLARGLRASYCPTLRDSSLGDLVNVIDAFYEDIKVSSLAEVPLLKNMPRILPSLQLDIPPGMNVLDWIAALNQIGLPRIRQIIAECFSGRLQITDESVTRDLVRLHAELDKIAKVRQAPTNRVELAGFVAAEILNAAADAVFWGMPTLLGLLTMWLTPKLWAKLKDNNVLADLWAAAEGELLGVNVTALRLLHVRERLDNALGQA